MPRPGFTLFEVLLALLIISAGVLGLADSLTRLVRLSAAGRQRGRLAVVFESRLDRLRMEARQAGCAAPSSGTANSDGVEEAWTARPAGTAIEAVMVARSPGAGAPDTLLVRFPCP
jgi:prepilin-type N-terminal cleavage/methylation domain-containing protein